MNQTMNGDRLFVEIDHSQVNKHGEAAPGDVFMSQRNDKEDRIVCVLADGLGSGIKASVLATMTATMAVRLVSAENVNIQKVSETIMNILPVCSVRKIAYSTFTIVDIQETGLVRIIEYENPAAILLRRGKRLQLDKAEVPGSRTLSSGSFMAREGDRVVLYSDGVSQSGMGMARMPFGWTAEKAEEFVLTTCRNDPKISAHRLAQALVERALANDSAVAKDDTTCAVISFRSPRNLLVLTGPPIDTKRDADMAALVREFPGKKAVCGGTTANIVARELDREVEVDLTVLDPEIPPLSYMKEVDLVTEGMITLGRVAALLEEGKRPATGKINAAARLVKLLLDSDIIEFVVGTKINEAHQDPNLPVELDIRRNIVKKITRLLNERYLKKASLRYI